MWSQTTRLLALALALAFLAPRSGLGQEPVRLPPPPTGPGQDLPPGVEPPDVALSEFFFGFRSKPLDAVQLAGLPAGSKPEVLTWRRAYALALIRAREAKPARFETLDANQLSARTQGAGVEDFARFRVDFASNQGFRDPAADLIRLQAGLLRVENARWNLASNERWAETSKILVEGESASLGPSDLEQAVASLSEARRDLARSVADYRDRLDTLKMALGLSLHAPVVVDSSPLAAFQSCFEETNRWFLDLRRELKNLDRLAARLPAIGDITIEARSVLAEIEREPGRLEEILALATRVALANRREGDEAGDVVELRVRRRLRHLAEIRGDYEHERRMSVLAVGQLDSVFEQIIAPPGGPTQGRSGQLTTNLFRLTRQVSECRSRLVALWTEFRAERLACYRDLGVLPFETWPSFDDQFTARPAK